MTLENFSTRVLLVFSVIREQESDKASVDRHVDCHVATKVRSIKAQSTKTNEFSRSTETFAFE